MLGEQLTHRANSVDKKTTNTVSSCVPLAAKPHHTNGEGVQELYQKDDREQRRLATQRHELGLHAGNLNADV